MRHCGTIRLETERLVLRRFVIEDAQAMFQNWAFGRIGNWQKQRGN